MVDVLYDESLEFMSHEATKRRLAMSGTIWDEAIVGDRLVVSLHRIWGITESSAMGGEMNAWWQLHLDSHRWPSHRRASHMRASPIGHPIGVPLIGVSHS